MQRLLGSAIKHTTVSGCTSLTVGRTVQACCLICNGQVNRKALAIHRPSQHLRIATSATATHTRQSPAAMAVGADHSSYANFTEAKVVHTDLELDVDFASHTISGIAQVHMRLSCW